MSSDIEILTRKISSAKEVNSEVVDAMNMLAALQLDKDAEGAHSTAQRAIKEARSIQYPKGEATGLVSAAMASARQRNYGQAADFYASAIDILEKINERQQVAEVRKKLGNVKYYLGKYTEAIEQYERAIEIRMMLGDELGTADLYANSGAMYGLLGNYAQGLRSQMQALKIFEHYGELSRLASTCSNIGTVYYELHDYDEALKMYQRALDIRKSTNDLVEVNDLLVNIANVYHEQKRFKDALDLHSKALEFREQSEEKSKIAISLSNIGDVYKALAKYPIALDYYNRALLLFEELKIARGLVPSYFNIGELYFIEEKYEQAENYLSKAIELAEETGLKDHLSEAYEHMAKIYAQDGKFEEAYKLHVRFTEMSKEVSNIETGRVIAQMTMRNEIEQKERSAELERVKNVELTKAYGSLEIEKKRSEELLLNILPEEVSEELKQFGKTKARSFDMVTVLFADIKGFTIISEQLSAEELVSGIDEYFEAFDKIVERHGVEKIKTIGDAYLCAGGVPVAETGHAEKIVAVAKDFIRAAEELRMQRTEKQLCTFDFRIGIHSGPVVAGVVGIKKFAYDIWGDTVNTASRMQQNSEPGRINISENTYKLIEGKFECRYRGEIEAKNKGKLKMYFVE